MLATRSEPATLFAVLWGIRISATFSGDERGLQVVNNQVCALNKPKWGHMLVFDTSIFLEINCPNHLWYEFGKS